MPPYALEDAVRLRFQLNDPQQPTPALIAACIDDAHDTVSRVLDPRFATSTPDGAIVLAEVLLAGAAVFRALMSSDALAQKRVTLGGQSIDDSTRFRSLNAVAESSVELAWRLLEPYTIECPARQPGDATATQPVLGEG